MAQNQPAPQTEPPEVKRAPKKAKRKGYFATSFSHFQQPCPKRKRGHKQSGPFLPKQFYNKIVQFNEQFIHLWTNVH